MSEGVHACVHACVHVKVRQRQRGTESLCWNLIVIIINGTGFSSVVKGNSNGQLYSSVFILYSCQSHLVLECTYVRIV